MKNEILKSRVSAVIWGVDFNVINTVSTIATIKEIIPLYLAISIFIRKLSTELYSDLLTIPLELSVMF